MSQLSIAGLSGQFLFVTMFDPSLIASVLKFQTKK